MGVVGLCVLGVLNAGSPFWGGVASFSGDVCFCCPPADGLFGAPQDRSSLPKTKLLTQSFKITSHRKFFNYSA